MNNMKDLYHNYVISRTANNRKGCPSPYSILRTIRAPRSIRKKLRLIEHISICSFCMEEFTILIKVDNLDCQHYSNITRQVQDFRASIISGYRLILIPRLIRYATLVISLILLITSYNIVREKEKTQLSLRGEEEGIHLIYPKQVHSLSRPLFFKWTGNLNADYYLLNLYNEEMVLIWTSPGLIETLYYLPEEILMKLEKNKKYFWMINVFSGTKKRTESKLTSFIAR